MAADGQSIDWVLVRNRISMLSSRNTRQVQTLLERIAARLGCRVVDGIAERVIFRSLFPTGMTVFDTLDDELLGGLPSMSHMSARQEYRGLVASLRLPMLKPVRAAEPTGGAAPAHAQAGAGGRSAGRRSATGF